MKIKSILPYPVEVPNLGIAAEPGEVVEVDDVQAEVLIESGAWVTAEKSRTTAAKEK
ncbi:MAG TPA: hypothetical protein PLG38_11425 [Propionibacteriaceae bacterium]|nr:hypothetical protein [Propionibacteriaceae bacterium]HQE32611.1 hypothetical protein [Propionibacteriaceae bacterium]